MTFECENCGYELLEAEVGDLETVCPQCFSVYTVSVAPCSWCHGSGYSGGPCSDCYGTGRQWEIELDEEATRDEREGATVEDRAEIALALQEVI